MKKKIRREDFQSMCEEIEAEITALRKMTHQAYYLMGYEDAKQGRRPNLQRVCHYWYWEGGQDGKDQQ